MRVCRLNRIKIKNPEKWDKAKYDDFVGNQFSKDTSRSLKRSIFGHKTSVKSDQSKKSMTKSFKKNPLNNQSTANFEDDDAETMLTINEEVTIFEFAPKTFQEVREMDNIDRDIIKFSLSAKRNRD